MTVIRTRNGLNADLAKSDAWRLASALAYQEGRRNAALTASKSGQRVTVRRAPVKPVSENRRVEAAVYRQRRLVFLEANPVCAAAPWHDEMGVDCDGRATTIQHKRGRVGDLYLDESLWLGLSLPCHQWVTDHPALAVEYGLAEKRIGAA